VTHQAQRRQRRRVTDLDPDDLGLVTATTKVTLQLALERMVDVMERAEQVLADEQEEQLGG
jgi:hypothetical protein